MSTQPTTFDELEAEAKNENLGGFGGDMLVRKKMQEFLMDMSRQTEKMINDAIDEAEKENKNNILQLVTENKKEVIIGSTITAATVAGAVLAPAYVAKAGIVLAGVAMLGAGYCFRDKFFRK